MQVVAAQEKKSWIHKWADTGSKLFQIAALTVAGAWAWVGFKQTVAPGLETKVGVSSELHWVAVPGTKRGTKICEASLQVKVNNPGKSPFDVEKATVTGWLVPLKENGLFPTDASDPKAVSPGKVSLLKYFYTGNGGSVSHDVADHYTEGVENTASFDLFFKYKPLTLVAFYVQIEGKRPSSYWPFLAAQVPLKDSYTYQVDQLCGGNWDSHTPEPKPASPAKISHHIEGFFRTECLSERGRRFLSPARPAEFISTPGTRRISRRVDACYLYAPQWCILVPCRQANTSVVA